MPRRCRRGHAMSDFLLSASAFVVLMVALGLVRVARGPGRAERMMAAQLLGTGAIGALLLFGAASGDAAVIDVALTLALLSAFASIAFVKFALRQDQKQPDDEAGEGAP
jgi:multicomponent Na+:H+ antiporter subunit F